MRAEEKKALSDWRMESAMEVLADSQSLLAKGSYRSAANRAYYAVYYAMVAVLAYDDVNMSKHSGVISEFRRRYIKTGILDKRLSPIITVLYDLRSDCDYSDYRKPSEAEVVPQVKNAEFFVEAIKDYLNSLEVGQE